MVGLRLIVIYDISDNESRERVARRLKLMGLARVQRSAFVGVGGVARAKDVARAVAPLIDASTDSVIVFVVPGRSVREAFVLGTPMAPLEGVRPYATV
ncbi:MAG: CRISPR-associated endonuclease Cas2 [Thermofilaceae archaeon]